MESIRCYDQLEMPVFSFSGRVDSLSAQTHALLAHMEWSKLQYCFLVVLYPFECKKGGVWTCDFVPISQWHEDSCIFSTLVKLCIQDSYKLTESCPWWWTDKSIVTLEVLTCMEQQLKLKSCADASEPGAMQREGQMIEKNLQPLSSSDDLAVKVLTADMQESQFPEVIFNYWFIIKFVVPAFTRAVIILQIASFSNIWSSIWTCIDEDYTFNAMQKSSYIWCEMKSWIWLPPWNSWDQRPCFAAW